MPAFDDDRALGVSHPLACRVVERCLGDGLIRGWGGRDDLTPRPHGQPNAPDVERPSEARTRTHRSFLQSAERLARVAHRCHLEVLVADGRLEPPQHAQRCLTGGRDRVGILLLRRRRAVVRVIGHSADTDAEDLKADLRLFELTGDGVELIAVLALSGGRRGPVRQQDDTLGKLELLDVGDHRKHAHTQRVDQVGAVLWVDHRRCSRAVERFKRPIRDRCHRVRLGDVHVLISPIFSRNRVLRCLCAVQHEADNILLVEEDLGVDKHAHGLERIVEMRPHVP